MQKIPFCNYDVIEFTTLETQCVYLPQERMQMRYKYIYNAPKSVASQLTVQGWRRFGHYFSRPACQACHACLSLRIDVNRFSFSRSARRTMQKNSHTTHRITTPQISDAHLALYEKYHLFKQKKEGWDYYPITQEGYEDLYLKGDPSYAREVSYYLHNRLIGVDLIDILEDGISAIYFYYDPDFSHLSLGRYSIYRQIEMAKEMGLAWIYLGYSVDSCKSLNYKLQFKPHQILYDRPELEQVANWRVS